MRKNLYILDYPNHEVKEAFVEHLLSSFRHGFDRKNRSVILRLPEYLEQEDFESFFDTMRAVFASIPYDIESKRDEAYFHTVFYLAITASGLAGQSSVLTSEGRIDLAVELPEKVYIMEFKCGQSAKTAIQQISDRHYADRYKGGGRKIILVGIDFDKDGRNIGEWLIKSCFSE